MSKILTEEVPEKVFLVFVNQDSNEDALVEDELISLCETAKLEVTGFTRQRVSKPTSATFIGKGKVEEIKIYAKDESADVILFDTELSGIQIRNIQDITGKKVVDRTGLILDIFACRAQTKEGKLQVELAQLTYLMPRLMSVYTKFERQKGGVGLRGPGETKLETDKRMVKDKITKLKKEIDNIKASRSRLRAQRRKHPFPFASLVGYTSAGKSTLMNLLANENVLADKMLFATLDPTTRKISFENGYSIFLTDTVGFIRNLPTHLIAAFRATLEEFSYSDFFLHIVDISHPDWRTQKKAVDETLKKIDPEEKPSLIVFNKIDAIDDKVLLPEIIKEYPGSVTISAKTGEGIDLLIEKILNHLKSELIKITTVIPYTKSELLEQCYQFGRVYKADYEEDGIHLEAELTPEMHTRIKHMITT